MYSQSWPGCALLPVWLFLLSERIFAMDSLENVFLFLDYLTDTQRNTTVPSATPAAILGALVRILTSVPAISFPVWRN